MKEIKMVNPILPLHAYIPDVEARVFRGSDGKERLFLYGSHDEYDQGTWCSHQYRVYSAPTDHLSEWTDHGVSFASRNGEGYIWEGKETDGVFWTDAILYAPDVLQIDGRYWLASCYSGGGLGMSVSGCPEGPFSPAVPIVYDDDLEPLKSIDPALYAEHGKVYLIWGQNTAFGGEGLVGVELEKDENGMYAVAKRHTKQYLFGDAQNPDQGFGFYEGPSIRKIGETYYVIYPSDKGKGIHMMSYATANAPLGPYTFGGNLLDNDGCDLAKGNNHGSLCEVNGNWYLFYHRGFGNSNMRRKVCVEKIEIEADGTIKEVVMTNHGFGGPLSPYQRINAAYATHVRLQEGQPGCYLEEYRADLHPLTHITDGNCVEYKDFDFGTVEGPLKFSAEIYPKCKGTVEIVMDEPWGEAIGTLSVEPNQTEKWTVIETQVLPVEGVHTLYLRFRGNQNEQICELAAFSFERAKENGCFSDVLASVWVSDNGDGTYSNALLWADYPDNDVIRVEDTYYMISTSMHLFPGCPVLSSKDLIHWHYESYALPYDQLLKLANEGHTLELKNGHVYDMGAWAASIRYHNKLKKFYFLVNMQDGMEEEYAVLSVADCAAGPWKLYRLSQRLYDPGLFFDEDGTAYVVHGQGQLYLTRLELVNEQSGEFKVDSSFVPANQYGCYDKPFYNYSEGHFNEGSHVYKIEDVYYILTTPTWSGTDTKKEICIQTKNLVDGPYEVRDIHRSFLNFGENGIHQGGIVDVPQKDGLSEWWAIIFQDRHKLGRTPTLQPVYWETDASGLKWPIIGEKGKYGHQAVTTYQKPNTGVCTQRKPNEEVRYVDDFTAAKLDLCWQWNHVPNDTKWSLTERSGYLRLYTATVTTQLSQAQNTLRQRVIGPESCAEVKLDIGHMTDGDVAGLTVHQMDYNYIGIQYDSVCNKKTIFINDNGTKEADTEIPAETTEIWLRAETVKMEYRTQFLFSLDGKHYTRLGGRYEMHYGCYVGMGFGIFHFAEKALGGYVDVDYFALTAGKCNSNYAPFGSKIEAEYFDNQKYEVNCNTESSQAHNLTTTWTADCAYTDELSKWGSAYGLAVSNLKDGDWMQYNRIDLGSGAKWFNARVSGISLGGILEVRQGSPKGDILSILDIPDTKGAERFENVFAKMNESIQGVQKLFLVYRGRGGICRINWFMFGSGKIPKVPDIPEMTVETRGKKQLEIRWNKVEGAAKYDIKIIDGEKEKIISNAESPFYERISEADGRYKIQIRSKNLAGYSQWSNIVWRDC